MDLTPCPFCGSDLTSVGAGEYNIDNVIHPIYFGECTGCGAMGPDSGMPEEARESWNRRPTPTTAAQGGRKVDPEVCTHENVTMVCLDCQPAAQGGDTREALARHLCLLKTGRDSFTGWDLIHEADKANWRGEADKILSLTHPLTDGPGPGLVHAYIIPTGPQLGREQAK